MSPAVETLSVALFLSFAACFVASALLQLVAWSRHAREGSRISMRGLWKPEAYFDDIGVRQMRIARGAFVIGVVMYLSYGIMMLVAGVSAKG